MNRIAFVLSFIVVLWLSDFVSGQDWKKFGGDEFFKSKELLPSFDNSILAKSWTKKIGVGLSGLVVDRGAVYTMSLQSENKPSSTEESVWAVDLTTGKTLWTFSYQTKWNKAQEAFGGKKRAPQATPAIVGDVVVTIGFTGMLHGLDRHSGKRLWSVDVVEEYKAIPVQFGFSSSPIPLDDRVLILTGGKKGGLVCLEANTGKQVWNVLCGEASYATPVIWNHESGRQVIFQDRNQLISASPKTGSVLWRYNLPKQGLTNVPTPLPVSPTGLVVSGQGIGGTKRLEVTKGKDGEWKIDPKWTCRSQFFYCNWMYWNEMIVGCDDKLLTVIDPETGIVVARWRGYANSNILGGESSVWVVDGLGRLSCFQTKSDQWKMVTRWQLFDQRTWTPLTLADGSFLGRAGDSIVCFKTVTDSRSSFDLVEKLEISKSIVELERKSKSGTKSADNVDYVQQILAVFEQKGTVAAWEEYQSIRKTRGKAFGVDSRLGLMELSAREGFYQLSRRIAKDVLTDFDDKGLEEKIDQKLAQLIRRPSSKPTTDNGKLIVEFGMENNSDKTADFHILGPNAKSFSYGISLPPGKTQVVKWPVGTKVFSEYNVKSKKVFVEVNVALAGKTVKTRKSKTGDKK